MTTLNVGHTDTMVLQQVDTNGNPMLTPVPYDSPPAWSQVTPATDSMAPSADGTQNVVTAVAAGTDTITATAVVGGKSYTASVALTVTPAPQVLGGIKILETVS